MVNNSSQLICPKCSASLPNNAQFCTECGTPIVKPAHNTTTTQRSTNPTIANEDPIESLKESGKDFMNEIGSLFQNAGQSPKKSAQSYNCPKCSASLPAGSKFCTECGTPLEQNPVKKEQNSADEFDQLGYLEKLAGLRDKGIISNEEFEKKKKDILKL
jgi:predicted amidophosphoribosyltransferase